MTRSLVLAATLLLLGFLNGQVNHYLAPLQVSLYLGGLLVTYAALHFGRRSGVLTMILGGMLADSALPIPFGTHVMLFTLAFLIIHRVRERIPVEERSVQVMVALFANLGIFLCLSLWRMGVQPSPAATWLRHLVDLALSQIAIVVIGPWFLALQSRALQLARLESRPLL